MLQSRLEIMDLLLCNHSSSEIKPQQLDQSKLVPLLVKTIQELEARLTAGGL